MLSNEETNEPLCTVSISNVPGLIESSGVAHFQCHAKKAGFFHLAMGIQISLLVIHGICSIASIVWCQYFRNVTSLLKHIEVMSKEQDKEYDETSDNGAIWIGDNTKTKENIFEHDDPLLKGKDFLFLFDMLAHTCGIEITLRILTHSDDQFYRIFKPNLVVSSSSSNSKAYVEEDKLKVEWHPSLAEQWLHPGNAPSFRSRIIDIDAYEATIFPAEKVENTLRHPAKMKERQKEFDPEGAHKSLLNENLKPYR
jgi:hypothetical protein